MKSPNKNKLSEPATQHQLKWLKHVGFDVESVSYTKGMVSEIIRNLGASKEQIELISYHKFDISKGITIGQAHAILPLIKQIKDILKP